MRTFIEAMETAVALPGEQATFGALMVALVEGVQRVAILGEEPADVVGVIEAQILGILGR